MKALFIHRSVGRNLIQDGRLYDLLRGSEVELNDYDHNSYELGDGTNKKKLDIVFEGGDTHPEHYATLFSQNGENKQKAAHSLIDDYDVIIIKSCYPNSHITSDEMLDTINGSYKSISEYFDSRPDKKLILLTSPPLVPMRTNQEAASRARTLSKWLTSSQLGNNTYVFDFYNLLAEPEDSRKPNVLKKKYRRLLPVDSHPNPKASEEIAPLFVDFINVVTSGSPSTMET